MRKSLKKTFSKTISKLANPWSQLEALLKLSKLSLRQKNYQLRASQLSQRTKIKVSSKLYFLFLIFEKDCRKCSHSRSRNDLAIVQSTSQARLSKVNSLIANESHPVLKGASSYQIKRATEAIKNLDITMLLELERIKRPSQAIF